jgi:hypothetical protein
VQWTTDSKEEEEEKKNNLGKYEACQHCVRLVGFDIFQNQCLVSV